MPEAPEQVRAGGVQVSIWENEGSMGKFYTVRLQRNYKDENGEWQNTQTLGVNDIPKAILALRTAYKKILLKE